MANIIDFNDAKRDKYENYKNEIIDGFVEHMKSIENDPKHQAIVEYRKTQLLKLMDKEGFLGQANAYLDYNTMKDAEYTGEKEEDYLEINGSLFYEDIEVSDIADDLRHYLETETDYYDDIFNRADLVEYLKSGNYPDYKTELKELDGKYPVHHYSPYGLLMIKEWDS